MHRIQKAFRNTLIRIGRHLHGLRIIVQKAVPLRKHIPIDREYLMQIMSDESPMSRLLSESKSAIKDAESINTGKFRIFSTVPLNFGIEPDWHLAGNNHHFPMKPAPLIRRKNGQGYDVKTVWELSRFQFIPSLLEAEKRTCSTGYIRTAEKLLSDWILNNPRGFGVNWVSGMEVALRAVNILLFTARITTGNSGYNPDDYSTVLWEHVIEIYEMDLKTPGGKRHNHYLVSTVCMIVLSMAFKGSKPDELLTRACTALRHEIKKQFRYDGINFESSVNYHRFTLEALLFLFAVIDSLDGKTIPSCVRLLREDSEVIRRIEQAAYFVQLYDNKFAYAPDIGDRDDGRVFFYRDYFGWNPDDHSYIMEMYESVFGKKPDSHPDSAEKGIRIFSDSGIAILFNDNYATCLYSTPVDRLAGGHNHCDKCSLVLDIGGIPVLVESGTGSYTLDPKMRNRLRSTGAHNTIEIDNREQLIIDPAMVFAVPEPVETSIGIEMNNGETAVVAEHNGYCRLQGVGILQRCIIPVADELVVADTVEGSGEHRIILNYVLHPSIETRVEENKIGLFHRSGKLCSITTPDGMSFETCMVPYSDRYASVTETERISFTGTLKLPTLITHRIILTVNRV